MIFRRARTDDYLLTGEELRLRRQGRKRIFVTAATILALLFIGIVAAKPTRNAIKSWQARRHAHKAFALIAAENWHDAHDEALAAYQLQPNEPDALRAVARFLSRIKDPEALSFWKQLKALSRDDLRDEAGIALSAGETETAESAIKSLFANASDKPSAADWLLDAQLAMLKQSPVEARKNLENVFPDSSATEDEQFQAALLELSLPTKGDGAARVEQERPVWARLQKLSEGKSATSLAALMVLARRALAEDPGPSDDPYIDSQNLVKALRRHPLSGPTQKLFALDLQMHSDPSRRGPLIAEGIAELKDAPAVDLAVLAEWLNVKGEFQRQLDTIPLEKALQNRDLFLRHLDALGALSQWDEIRQLLEAERFPLDRAIQQMYLARCYAQLGQKTAASNNWQRALEAAGEEVPKLMQLADFAEKNGALEVADSACSRVLEKAPRLRSAFAARVRIARAQKETQKMHDILAQMLTIWPDDRAVQNDEAYSRLLLLSPRDLGTQRQAVEVEKLAEKLVQREPKSLAHRTLLALARLRAGLPESALGAYDITVPEEVLTPGAIAIRAAALRANGRGADADLQAKRCNAGQLLPEEVQLLHLTP